jgi:hypothetical protein
MLQLVQQATGEMGVAVPNSVAGNTNQDVVQLYALINAVGYELLQYPWRTLTKPYRFYTQYVQTTGNWTTAARTISGIPSTTGLDSTYMAIGTGINQDAFISTVDSSTQVTMNQDFTQAGGTDATVYFAKVKYDLPSDYDALIPRSMWDKSKHWEMLGPEDAQQWEWLLSGYISTGPRIRWRLYGDYFQIWPPNTTNEYLGFEYRSKGWAASTGGTVQNSFTADSDTCIYQDRLMVNGLKLKYFEAKGFDTTAMYRNYATQLESSLALDKSSANLSFAPRPGNVLIGYDNIPDSGYGLP